MKAGLLILRPEPGNGATAARAAALGWHAIRSPLFTVRPIDWPAAAPDGFDGVVITSANAARLGGAGLARLTGLPLYAVGKATAKAARAAGFADLRIGGGDGAALLDLVEAAGATRLLHLAGREHRLPERPRLSIERRIVYAAEAVEHLPLAAGEALADGAIALLHSPRAAALFAGLVDTAGLVRDRIRIAAISPATRDAAGRGWSAAVAAASPDDDALLAAAARLCE